MVYTVGLIQDKSSGSIPCDSVRGNNNAGTQPSHMSVGQLITHFFLPKLISCFFFICNLTVSVFCVFELVYSLTLAAGFHKCVFIARCPGHKFTAFSL